MKRLLAVALGLALGALPLGGAVAQSTVYPSKPIKIIVPFDPGGGTDAVATAFVDELSQRLGKPVIKSNHPGSNSIIGTTLLVKSPPDGHTRRSYVVGNDGGDLHQSISLSEHALQDAGGLRAGVHPDGLSLCARGTHQFASQFNC
jgi:tripartite-type tricarboxylate transporter receptor subunit TctC